MYLLRSARATLYAPCHPGNAGAHINACQAEGLAIQRPTFGDLVRYFTTDIGVLSQVIHL